MFSIGSMSEPGSPDAGCAEARFDGLKNAMSFMPQLLNALCAGVDTCKLLEGTLVPRLEDGVLKLPRLVGTLEPYDDVPSEDVPSEGMLRPDKDDGMLKAPDETITPAISRTISATITRFILLPSIRCCVK
jgi:hypothetical protein